MSTIIRASSHKHCHHALEFPGNPGRVINHLVWLLPPQTLAKGSYRRDDVC